MFLAIFKTVNHYICRQTSLSATTPISSMTTNLKFPIFVLAVNISLFTNLLLIKYWVKETNADSIANS